MKGKLTSIEVKHQIMTEKKLESIEDLVLSLYELQKTEIDSAIRTNEAEARFWSDVVPKTNVDRAEFYAFVERRLAALAQVSGLLQRSLAILHASKPETPEQALQNSLLTSSSHPELS